MPKTIQEFLGASTRKAADDLKAALLGLPEDKRGWSAQGDARTPLDLAAECAILNGATAATIEKRAFPSDFMMDDYPRAKAELSKDEDALLALLEENTVKLIEAIRAVPDDALDHEVKMPWGPMALTQIMAYPFWNMSYHEGQTNYIASMLGCLA
jgi:hypothetical protein